MINVMLKRVIISGDNTPMLIDETEFEMPFDDGNNRLVKWMAFCSQTSRLLKERTGWRMACIEIVDHDPIKHGPPRCIFMERGD